MQLRYRKETVFMATTIRMSCLNQSFSLPKMSSPSQQLKGRLTACQKLDVDGSPLTLSCPTMHSSSPTSLKCCQGQLNALLIKIVELALSYDSKEDAFQIVETAIKELLNTDRASLFLLDDQTQELYAQVFSVSDEETSKINRVSLPQDPSGPLYFKDYVANHGKTPIPIVAYRGKKVSLPISKGVIGYVARTGKLMNVESTRKNKHFCGEIDEFTGYKTDTLLCAPLTVNGKVIGVVEAVNKNGSCFSISDEQLLQSIALACSLYISHSHFQKECKRLDSKYKVANEILDYHRQCPEQKMKEANAVTPVSLQQYDIESFSCDTKYLPDDIKPHLFVKMVSNLVDSSLFSSEQMLKFALTVSKNYRPNPYHNWDHAFHVAQCMYCVLKGSKDCFTDMERLALLLACLCHDLDHRALSNGYLVATEHPLCQLYSSSILENHHFSQTIALLQLEGLNVLSQLTETQYQEVLEIMQKAIIATDLVNFFGNKSELSEIVDAKSFSWEIPRHKELVKCLMMTICDLCGTCKPWEIHSKCVVDIYDEFYDQGDLEKSKGLNSIEMMDRNLRHKLPEFQVGFIGGIAEPCSKLLANVMPHVDTLLQTTRTNKKMWQDIIDKKLYPQ